MNALGVSGPSSNDSSVAEASISEDCQNSQCLLALALNSIDCGISRLRSSYERESVGFDANTLPNVSGPSARAMMP